MSNEENQVSQEGEKIKVDEEGNLVIPDNPIITYIEGDGAGADIWKSAKNVIDSSIKRAYGKNREIFWKEVFAGDKAYKDENDYLPDISIETIKEHIISLSGPLKNQVLENGPLSEALIHQLDLYSNLRHISWIEGIPTPISNPENINMMIFCENTEDVFAGIELGVNHPQIEKLKELLHELEFSSKLKYIDTTAFSIRPISKEGTFRLVRSAIQYAIDHDKESVTLVHKGNLMRQTEGSFVKWAYEVAKSEFSAKELGDGNWCTMKNPKTNKTITIKDSLADVFLQDVLLRPMEFDVIATMSLNGDYIADLLSAEIGAIALQPEADINFESHYAIFKTDFGADHKFAGQNKVNPGSLIRSGELMLRYINWNEAADLIDKGIRKAIANKTVTYDLGRIIEDARIVDTYEFGVEIVNNMY